LREPDRTAAATTAFEFAFSLFSTRRIASFFREWQVNGEQRAVAQTRTLRVNAAAVQFHQMSHDG
jgi:hypothetical protein